MKTWTLILGLSAALAAGCDQTPPQPTATPGGAASGASGAPQTGPNGDRVELPAPPPGTKEEATKPDPGDANDHSNPQHDAREKAASGKSGD